MGFRGQRRSSGFDAGILEMTQDEAFAMIRSALDATKPDLAGKVSEATHLIADGILDSLDSMNFLFELETLHGSKLSVIDETFDDFRVTRLIEILVHG